MADLFVCIKRGDPFLLDGLVGGPGRTCLDLFTQIQIEEQDGVECLYVALWDHICKLSQ